MSIHSTTDLLASLPAAANFDQDLTTWVITLTLGALALIFFQVWVNERFDVWEQAQEDRDWHRLASTVDRGRRDFR